MHAHDRDQNQKTIALGANQQCEKLSKWSVPLVDVAYSYQHVTEAN